MGWDFQGSQISQEQDFGRRRQRARAVDNARQDRERGDGTSFDTASCAEVEEPWRFPVGLRHISGSVRDCVKFRGKVFRVPWRMRRILFCSVC